MPNDFSDVCASLKKISADCTVSAQDGMWDESKHPRKNGRFASVGQGETFSNKDALAVHEAMAKANWEHLKNGERADNYNAAKVSLENTPLSDYMKSSTKLNTLTDLSKVVKPGEPIKWSGIGQLHREQLKKADKHDTRPEYGPEGAKRHMEGFMAKTHPYHQGVIEAYKSVGEEARKKDDVAHNPSVESKSMPPVGGTMVVRHSEGSKPLREVHWDAKIKSLPREKRSPADWDRVDPKKINPNLPK